MGRVYNFQGLHTFKAKFATHWEPRYLVSPARDRAGGDGGRGLESASRPAMSGPVCRPGAWGGGEQWLLAALLLLVFTPFEKTLAKRAVRLASSRGALGADDPLASGKPLAPEGPTVGLTICADVPKRQRRFWRESSLSRVVERDLQADDCAFGKCLRRCRISKLVDIRADSPGDAVYRRHGSRDVLRVDGQSDIAMLRRIALDKMGAGLGIRRSVSGVHAVQMIIAAKSGHQKGSGRAVHQVALNALVIVDMGG